jgi:hypothetical protein
MTGIRKLPRIIGLFGVLAALSVAFVTFVRPWYLNWGATDEERGMLLPGDEIIPNARSQQTRAITIRAPANLVWPWLAQLGQDRGGFYSFDVLENLVGCEMPTIDVLRSDKQAWQLGDKLWMYPKEKGGGTGFATLRTFIPGRALGFAARPVGAPLTEPEAGSWSMVLEPVAASTTRLLIRGRGAPGRSLVGMAFDWSTFEPIHFVMERRMMVGIKQLVETGNRGRLSNHVLVALWLITFCVFLAAGVLVMRAKEWGRALAGFAVAGIVFQVLTFVQPPAPVGLTLVWMVLAILWWPSAYVQTIAAVREPDGFNASPDGQASRAQSQLSGI